MEIIRERAGGRAGGRGNAWFAGLERYFNRFLATLLASLASLRGRETSTIEGSESVSR